jgi:predicted transposase YdaD
MGLAQQLRQEGRREGRQEGRREGRQEGRQEGIPHGEALILRRQLTRRFGPLPAWAEQALNTAPPERLEALADRILDADSLDAVFQA